MSEGDFTPSAGNGGFKKATRAQRRALEAAYAQADELARENREREAREQAAADGELDGKINAL